MTRQISFNLFEMNTVGHISHGLWVHPDNTRQRYKDLDFWLDHARLVEEGLFDAIFLADVLGVYDGYRNGPETSLRVAMQVPNNDPLLLVPAMATATKHLAFAVTFSITYEPPFAWARRASTLDHLTRGRIGWNIVTSSLPNAARNFGLDEMIAHDSRYDLADEYLDVTYKLWEHSWDDDAVLDDPERGIYTDPAKVRYINHVGEHYKVAGPHLSEPSVQRTPVLFQAGGSERGRIFAAKHAEAVYMGAPTYQAYHDNIIDLRRRVVANGRRADQIKVFVGAVIIAGQTHEEAERKAEEFRRLSSAEGYLAHSGASGIDLAAYPPDALVEDILRAENQRHRDPNNSRYVPGATVADELRRLTDFERRPFVAIGTGPEVADQIAGWVRDHDVDGFNLRQFLTPGSVEDFIEYVVPELQKRGLYRTKYEETTLRERYFGAGQVRLPDEHYGARFRASA